MDFDDAQMESLEGFLASGDLDAAVEMFASDLEAGGIEPFASAARGGFATTSSEVREWLAFAAGMHLQRNGPFPALYVEMNEFDINPGEWWAMVEAWASPLATFSDVESSAGPVFAPLADFITLSGWEDMQEAFAVTKNARDAAGRLGEPVERAWSSAVFLVHVQFLRLVERALAAGPLVGVEVPIAVTTHDMDPGIVLTPLLRQSVGSLTTVVERSEP